MPTEPGGQWLALVGRRAKALHRFRPTDGYRMLKSPCGLIIPEEHLTKRTLGKCKACSRA